MENDKMQVATIGNQGTMSIYSSDEAFERAQRMAKALCSSDLVPAQYKGNISNTLVALEMANRTGASPLMVMQNLDVIKGKPSWSSSFIIAALNSCGRFTPLRFKVVDHGPTSVNYEVWFGPQNNRQKQQKTIEIHNKTCIAFARDVHGDLVEGPPVSIEMAVKEGWYTKSDSKWVTMPDLMLNYRAAAFFGRLYAPDILQGMHTGDEMMDIGNSQIGGVGDSKTAASTNNVIQGLNERVADGSKIEEATIITEDNSAQQGNVSDDEEII